MPPVPITARNGSPKRKKRKSLLHEVFNVGEETKKVKEEVDEKATC